MNTPFEQSKTGGLYAFNVGKQIASNPLVTFHSCIQAAMNMADAEQLTALKNAFPDVWEARAKYGDEPWQEPITAEDFVAKLRSRAKDN